MSNLKELAQLMKGRNPQEVAMAMIKNQKIEDPTLVQLIQLAQSGQTGNFENLASMLFQANGLNMDEELAAFMELLK